MTRRCGRCWRRTATSKAGARSAAGLVVPWSATAMAACAGWEVLAQLQACDLTRRGFALPGPDLSFRLYLREVQDPTPRSAATPEPDRCSVDPAITT